MNNNIYHHVLVYVENTGEIVSNSSMSDEMMKLNPQYKYIRNGAGYYGSHYVVNGTVKERPTQNTMLTGNILTNLPTPCVITINGTRYECNDTKAELEFNQPTTYVVCVEAWPYKDLKVTYENHA